MFRIINEGRNVVNLILMSDRPIFVNKQNMRSWAPVNPGELHEQPLHTPEMIIWCGVETFGMAEPFFFENDNGESIGVTAERYVVMLKKLVSTAGSI